MKNLYLLALALLVSTQVIAADKDSVYAWGAWSQNIQPAAGPVASVTPAAIAQPNVNFRPNENAAFARVAQIIPATPAVTITVDPSQLPGIVSTPVGAPVISADNLPATTGLSL